MDYKEKANILRVCSSKNGERCSRCPAFGQGDRHCMKNAMKDGAAAITDLLARAEAAEDKIKQMTPCDRCEYGPPSSGDGKPCSFCPASKISKTVFKTREEAEAALKSMNKKVED